MKKYLCVIANVSNNTTELKTTIMTRTHLAGEDVAAVSTADPEQRSYVIRKTQVCII